MILPNGKLIINNADKMYIGNTSNRMVEFLNKSSIESLTQGALKYVKTNIVKTFNVTKYIKWQHTSDSYTLLNEKITWFEERNLYPLWYTYTNNKIQGTFTGEADFWFSVRVGWNAPAAYDVGGAYSADGTTTLNYTPNDTDTFMLPLTGSIDYPNTQLRYNVTIDYNNGNGNEATFTLNVTYTTVICALCLDMSMFA